MKVVQAFCFILIGLCINAQVPFLGPCPELKAMEGFDVNKYLGKWYEAERYFSMLEFGSKCVNTNFTDGVDDTINVVNVQTSALTGIISKLEGEVKKPVIGGKERIDLKFPYLPMDAPYWILDTDYDNYSVVWSCNNFGLFSTRNAWIFTRERSPSLEVMEKAYSVIDKNFISRAFLIRTDQKNCPEDH